MERNYHLRLERQKKLVLIAGHTYAHRHTDSAICHTFRYVSEISTVTLSTYYSVL